MVQGVASHDKRLRRRVYYITIIVRLFKDEDVEITIVRHPSGTFAGLDSVNFNTAKIPIPPRLETPWVYMTCYLLLISWGDSRAKSYFEVVSSLLGLREDKNEK